MSQCDRHYNDFKEILKVIKVNDSNVGIYPDFPSSRLMSHRVCINFTTFH